MLHPAETVRRVAPGPGELVRLARAAAAPDDGDRAPAHAAGLQRQRQRVPAGLRRPPRGATRRRAARLPGRARTARPASTTRPATRSSTAPGRSSARSPASTSSSCLRTAAARASSSATARRTRRGRSTTPTATSSRRRARRSAPSASGSTGRSGARRAARRRGCRPRRAGCGGGASSAPRAADTSRARGPPNRCVAVPRDLAAPGPYAVPAGHRSAHAAQRGRARASPRRPDRLAPRRARPAARPLILFSHGHNGSPGSCSRLCAHLAGLGFVVLAVTHPDRGTRRPAQGPERVEDLLFLLDHLPAARAGSTARGGRSASPGTRSAAAPPRSWRRRTTASRR